MHPPTETTNPSSPAIQIAPANGSGGFVLPRKIGISALISALLFCGGVVYGAAKVDSRLTSVEKSTAEYRESARRMEGIMCLWCKGQMTVDQCMEVCIGAKG